MTISEIKLSFPCRKYDVNIVHLTSRKSTALEWVILEAIAKVSQCHEYDNVTIADLFGEIFGISDCDMIIKPLLLQLQDIGAIKATGVNDEISLSSIPMKSLSLTKDGEKMQKNGLLPGAKDEARISLLYDIYMQKLMPFQKYHVVSNPTGMTVMDINNDDIAFPAALVRSMLDEKKAAAKRENKREYGWLRETTEISDITPVETQECWRDITQKGLILSDCRFSIDGITDDELNTKALELIQIPENNELLGAPDLEIKNPDEELNTIIPASDIEKKIRLYLYQDAISIVRESYLKNNPYENTGIKNDRKVKAIVIVGNSDITYEIANTRIVVHVPEQSIPSDVVYLGSSGALHVGKVKLHTNSLSRQMPVAFVPKNGDTETAAVCMDIVNKHYVSMPEIVLLIATLENDSIMEQYIKLALSTRQNLSDKATLIESLNKSYSAMTKRKLVTPDKYEVYIADETTLAHYCVNTESLCLFITELKSMMFIKQNIDTFSSIIRKAIPKLEKEPSGISEIWKLSAAIAEVKPAFVKALYTSGITKGFYNDEVKRELLSLISTDTVYENADFMKEYTAVESTLLDIKRLYDRVESLLPNVSLTETYSVEYIREQLLQNKDKISGIYNEISLWRELVEKFNNNIGDFDDYCETSNLLASIKKFMEIFSDAISIFFNDITKKYGTIYILDTCALMHEPEILNEFEDGKALVIIPRTVLSELDHLKISDNEEKSISARAAIRIISNHNAYEWVDLREEAAPELLPDELDADKNDFLILSIANKYCVKRPTVITDDINMRNIAKSLGIETMDRDGFHQAKLHARDTSKGKYGRKKK